MIKILSLNIELNKHLKKIIKFISKKKPEVLLLQEVMKKDIVELKKNLGMDYCVFTPTNLMPYQGKMHTIGIATFSKYEFKFINIHYYRGSLKKYLLR